MGSGRDRRSCSGPSRHPSSQRSEGRRAPWPAHRLALSRGHMRHKPHLHTALSALAVPLLWACASTSGSPPSDASPPDASACPPLPADQNGFFHKDQLPQGACSGQASCMISMQEACCIGPNGPIYDGPIDGYQCDCSNGSWTCALRYLGSSGCRTCAEGGTSDGSSSDGLQD